MGVYLNPGNSGFAEMLRSGYVDKTGMIGLINSTVGTKKKLTCISRPRRFGKSYAAQTLCAYYDKTCDSHALFDQYEIAKEKSYDEHLQKYDVIYLDMSNLLGNVEPSGLIRFIVENVTAEIIESYPEVMAGNSFDQTLARCVSHTGNKFIMIIDEWDAPIRETPEIEEDYLKFLRMLFKSSGTTSKIFAAAYMTGILPIKKDGNQSAVSDFEENSVMEPGAFAGYVGFTEEDVRECCESHGKNFEKLKRWYDGYTFGDRHSMYNPYSVMKAINTGRYQSYWKKTSAADTLMTYIDMDQDGLQEDIARLIAGERIEVDPDSFLNDVETFTCKDDVLTLLIHLGYLTSEEVPNSYDDEQWVVLARIPNEEVRTEFNKILRKAKHQSLATLVKKSDQLLKDTLNGNSDAVAKAIADVHESEYAPTFYNNEQSLRYVVKMAYISCVDQYAKVEELPSGHGIADLVFLPKRRSPLPAMIVELKWNKNADGAIAQIREKHYPKVLENYGEKILLVGINYDEKSGIHSCVIEEYRK